MIIKDTAHLQEYATVSSDLDYKSITPSLRNAERRYIIPMIGMAFYLEIEAIDTPMPIEAKLIDYLCSAIAPLAMWHYSLSGGVSIDNSGVYKPKNDQRWNLSETEQKRLELALLNTGMDALDDLANFLQDNIGSFTTYAGSLEYTKTKSTLVPTASIVAEVFTMLHPQLTFRALGEGILDSQRRMKALMQDWYQRAVAANDLSDDENRIRDIARRATVYLATARAMITRTVSFTHAGLDVQMDSRNQLSLQENSRIEAAAREYLATGEKEIETMLAELDDLQPTGYTKKVIEATSAGKCSEHSRIAFF